MKKKTLLILIKVITLTALSTHLEENQTSFNAEKEAQAYQLSNEREETVYEFKAILDPSKVTELAYIRNGFRKGRHK